MDWNSIYNRIDIEDCIHIERVYYNGIYVYMYVYKLGGLYFISLFYHRIDIIITYDYLLKYLYTGNLDIIKSMSQVRDESIEEILN